MQLKSISVTLCKFCLFLHRNKKKVKYFRYFTNVWRKGGGSWETTERL